MLLQSHFNLPTVKAEGWEIIKCLPCVRVYACVHLSYFYIKLCISFSYEDIFTKFAKNLYACENMSVKYYGTHFKSNMTAIADCSKIIDML